MFRNSGGVERGGGHPPTSALNKLICCVWLGICLELEDGNVFDDFRLGWWWVGG